MARRSGRRSQKSGKNLVEDRTSIARLIDSRAAVHHEKQNKTSKDGTPQTTKLQEQFGAVLDRFKIPIEKSSSDSGIEQTYSLVHQVKGSEDQVREDNNTQNEEDKKPDMKEMSKRKLRKLTKPSLSQLKSSSIYPQVIEWYDCDAPYPYLLATIKSSKNVVPIPGHWQMKREYLSGRSLMEKRPFELPDVIKQTDIEIMRKTLPDKEAAQNDKSLKEISRARVQPKMGSLDIDYKKLHDVFFKLGANWKPEVLLSFGDVYYENRNLYDEAQWKKLEKEKTVGRLSSGLREIMGISEGQLPPWCMKMKNLNMPPSYPNLKVAGLNWGIENMKGEIYGVLDSPSTNKKTKSLFGTIISIKDENLDSPQEDNSNHIPEEKGKVLRPIQNDYKEKLTEVQSTTVDRPKVEERRLQADDNTKKSLYTVLKEGTVDDAAGGNGSKAVYVMPGTDGQGSEEREAASSKPEDEKDDQEDIENFKF